MNEKCLSQSTPSVVCFLFSILLSTFWRSRYTPQTIDLDHKLKPFIPDFIPAVGDIDAFIKVSEALFHGHNSND